MAKKMSRIFENVKGIKVLNIGCGYSKVTISGINEIRLDADPNVHPDIVLDIHNLKKLPKQSCDGAWCSHVLEHFYEHELPEILDGIRHILKKNGVLFAMVPDLKALFNEVVCRNLGLNDVIYMSGMGPVRPRDMLYGFQKEMATGNVFYSHKTGFDAKAFYDCLAMAGFKKIFIVEHNLQIDAIACLANEPEWIKPFIKGK